jgi:hypothetical protein
MIGRLHCCGLEVRQNVMAREHVVEEASHLLTTRNQRERNIRRKDPGTRYTSSVTTSSKRVPPPNSPFTFMIKHLSIAP